MCLDPQDEPFTLCACVRVAAEFLESAAFALVAAALLLYTLNGDDGHDDDAIYMQSFKTAVQRCVDSACDNIVLLKIHCPSGRRNLGR